MVPVNSDGQLLLLFEFTLYAIQEPFKTLDTNYYKDSTNLKTHVMKNKKSDKKMHYRISIRVYVCPSVRPLHTSWISEIWYLNKRAQVTWNYAIERTIQRQKQVWEQIDRTHLLTEHRPTFLWNNNLTWRSSNLICILRSVH